MLENGSHEKDISPLSLRWKNSHWLHWII